MNDSNNHLAAVFYFLLIFFTSKQTLFSVTSLNDTSAVRSNLSRIPSTTPLASQKSNFRNRRTFSQSPDNHLVRPKSLSSILYPPESPPLGRIANSLQMDPKMVGHSFPLINLNSPKKGFAFSLSTFCNKYLIFPRLSSQATFLPRLNPNSLTICVFSTRISEESSQIEVVKLRIRWQRMDL